MNAIINSHGEFAYTLPALHTHTLSLTLFRWTLHLLFHRYQINNSFTYLFSHLPMYFSSRFHFHSIASSCRWASGGRGRQPFGQRWEMKLKTRKNPTDANSLKLKFLMNERKNFCFYGSFFTTHFHSLDRLQCSSLFVQCGMYEWTLIWYFKIHEILSASEKTSEYT